jgi:glutathione S-transferase
MITLYQIHFSHYVEKVRWALDYKGLPWRPIEIDPFTKRQMQHLPKSTLGSGQRLHTVPAIHDEASGAMVGDSSEILIYLERQYPAPPLYPEDAADRDKVSRWVTWLDCELGLASRRLFYAQLALEHPGYLAELFSIVPRGRAHRLKARLAGAIMAGILTQRFRLDRNREDRVFERLEQCLLFAAARLNGGPWLVGERFTAADLTLAALLRPVTAAPFFRDHPQLQRLFEWRDALTRHHRREFPAAYEVALHAVRRRRGWALGSVSWMPRPAETSTLKDIPTAFSARNDQQPVARRPLLSGAVAYLRLRLSSGLRRTVWRPTE